MDDLRYIDRGDGEKLAYRKIDGRNPGVVWVGGFRSDMNGTKAAAVADWATRMGRAGLRFDYYGHGASSGDFAHGTITRWRDDALVAFDALTKGPQIVVGSSMGGWIATLLAQARADRIAALVLLAPAPDFTEALIWDLLSDAAKDEILETGQWLYTAGNDGYPITRALIESGRRHLVLDKPMRVHYPVRILQGMADREVPWRHALKLVDILEGDDIRLTYIKNGEHRLSSPQELKLLEQTLAALDQEICA
jgi:pimeloyl-ACP methyl ester carboxylesterase